MRLKALSILLALLLLLSSLTALSGCNGNDVPDEKGSETETVDKTDGTETPTENDESEKDTKEEPTEESELPTDEETEEETTEAISVDLDSIVYENGGKIAQAGYVWEDDAFALTEREYDESKAVEKTAADIIALLKDKEALVEGEVYIVNEPIVLESNTKYYGNLACVIATQGIVIKDAEEIVIKELAIKGKITVENSKGITFFKLYSTGADVAVSVDNASYDIAFKQCKIYATDTAIVTKADLTSIYLSYLCADKGVVAEADNFAIQESHVIANTVGITSSGAYCTAKDNVVEMAADGVGIELASGSYNALAALNVVNGAQKSITVTDGFNCVVLLNSAIRIIGKDTTNLYVVENALGGAIELENNTYLLCDGNTFAKDGKPHPVVNTGNSEYNGDGLHDVNKRVKYGANEELLPHTNKDLFIDMERQRSVSDIAEVKKYNVSNYLRMNSKENDIVIVPPGAYAIDNTLNMSAVHSNTQIYGFGAYIESTYKGVFLYAPNITNVKFKGLTLGYSFQSSGQVYLLEKMKDRQILVVTNAGYIDDFGQSNPDYFANNAVYMFRDEELCCWYNLGASYKFIKKNDDGTIVLQLTGTDAAKIHGSIKKGDIFTCRLSGDNASMLSFSGAHDVLLKDCVFYGYSSALGVVAGGKATGIELERVHNTAHSQLVIDEATYNKYVELENQYGADLEVSIDEEGRFRGGIPRIGSVDATHITGAGEGVDATSCLFEQMCDDGSNQRASSSRIAGYHDNGDGTTTIYFKGTISETYWNLSTNAYKTESTPSNCTTPKKGDKIYSYASDGHVLFDTVALTDAVAVKTSPLYHVSHVDKLVNSEIKEGDVKEINGTFDSPTMCVDGLCDVCGKITHFDIARDGKCDICKVKVHVEFGTDGKCDVSGCGVMLEDKNGDNVNDSDSAPIIKERFSISYFNLASGEYRVAAAYSRDKWYKITYKTKIYEIKVKTADVDFEAFEGYDLTDNEYKMDNKILLDNLSANSIGFTFDNVMVRNSTARGVLCKTHDATIKNCTFRSNSSTGILLSVETTWGESTVPRNVTVIGCLFDDTGRNQGRETNTTYSCIAIQGLGANSTTIAVSDNTLPCSDIRIIGNKFINVNNRHAISVTAAKNILIQNNVFEARPEDNERTYGKAVYINGVMDIELSGNTYSSFARGDMERAVTALNYQGLTGTDVEGKLPEDKLPE